MRRLLRTTAYVGTARWGATAWGKYHSARGEDIVSTNGNGKHRGRRQKPLEDAIAVEGAHEGIIPVALFNRVQRKLPQCEKTYRPSRRARLSVGRLDLLRELRATDVRQLAPRARIGRAASGTNTLSMFAAPTSTTAVAVSTTQLAAGTPSTPAGSRLAGSQTPASLPGAGSGCTGPRDQEATQRRTQGQQRRRGAIAEEGCGLGAGSISAGQGDSHP